jgi:hypothetical protein
MKLKLMASLSKNIFKKKMDGNKFNARNEKKKRILYYLFELGKGLKNFNNFLHASRDFNRKLFSPSSCTQRDTSVMNVKFSTSTRFFSPFFPIFSLFTIKHNARREREQKICIASVKFT